MKIAYADTFKVDLPSEHRFPMLKYELVREQLLYEGVFRPSQMYQASFMPDDVILLTHTEEYWARVKALRLSDAEARRIGFPQSASLVRRSWASASGTLESAQNALRDGAALNLAGGTHHAYAEHGEGFCVLNDVAIAANYLLHVGAVKRALIIDLDVHQGNGTAKIFENEARVFTFSVHCAANYPLRKETSDADFHLPAYLTDEPYLTLISQQIPELFEKIKPDIVFYIAGVDVIAGDKLGKLSLTRGGCLERDKIVLYEAQKRQTPVVVVMGGGYAERLTDIVAAHCNTFRLLADLFD